MAQAKKNNFEETEVEDNVTQIFETKSAQRKEPQSFLSASKDQIEFANYLHLGARKWSQQRDLQLPMEVNQNIVHEKKQQQRGDLTDSNPSLSTSTKIGQMLQNVKYENAATTPSGLSQPYPHFSGGGQIEEAEEDQQQFENLYRQYQEIKKQLHDLKKVKKHHSPGNQRVTNI